MSTLKCLAARCSELPDHQVSFKMNARHRCIYAGSGKTTLLNAVAGRVQGTVGGVILLNRAELCAPMFADLCEYISMKETPIPCISVKETLNYHAQLTLSSSMSATERNERVISIMQDFELINYAHDKVEDLSESARRRLIIGVHLLRDPSKSAHQAYGIVIDNNWL